jgi:hypothetical protein
MGVVLKKFVGWVVIVGIAAWIHEGLAIAVVLLSAVALPMMWFARRAPGSSAIEPATPAAARGREHRPKPPRGTPVAPWSVGGVTRINAVGESKYPEGLRGALSDFGHPLTSMGTELSGARAVVATDPTNPYDSNAVGVWIEGRHLVGYLPAELAAQYAPALSQLEEEGCNLRVPARVWIAERNGVFGSVSLSMPSPHGVLSFNELPEEPHCILPAGKALQITGEDGHMDVLTRYVHDNQRHLAVTLHVVPQPAASARSQASEVVEVRLDGSRIGCLTKASSEAVRDLVAYVADRGRVPVARAVLKGSSIKADVTLFLARSSEVTQKWLDGVDDASTSPT